MMDKIINAITNLMLGAVMLVLILMLFGICYDEAKTEIVETYTVGCEVSQMAYAEETTGRSTSRPVYKMGVRNDEFAATLDITDAQFAKYVVGDIVEIEVTVRETGLGVFKYEYKLLGHCKEIYF